MKNILGKEVPDFIEGYGEVSHYSGIPEEYGEHIRESVSVKSVFKGEKVFTSIDSLLDKLNLKDGMTLSFHHHLRNGDYVLNLVMTAIAKRGLKDLTIAASSLFPIHEPLVKMMEDGVVTGISADYISGPVAEAISKGKLKTPVVMMTHGGRPMAIETGRIKIDVAFIGAPTSDTYGNINGTQGPSACGTLGYAVADAQHAEQVVAITDNLVPYPASSIDISQEYIDYVLKVDSIGDPKGIVSGTTQITKDPVGLKIAENTVDAIEASGYLKDGLSFQTGAGGTSLAVADELAKRMREEKIVGSFASGGITGYIVDMLEEGLFKNILDVQCFDLKAVESYTKNANHLSMSGSMYANPFTKGAVVDNLDIVILGATEIDTHFNVNVTTDSNGIIMGGSGGHSDTAAGSKLTIIVTNLTKARLPIVKDEVTTITTPGETVDMLVTERGTAINPLRKDLIEKAKKAGLQIKTIEELKEIAETLTGKPKELTFNDRIVGVMEYRDGSVVDVIREVKN